MPETNRIEYKRELSEGLEKEVVAFLEKRFLTILQSGKWLLSVQAQENKQLLRISERFNTQQ
ncbi:hypothetical protein [Gillisia limnaea]|uniref:Uncharacterized protein n=1 Tax=Gillisia limnaea (strain DSM 15749 / LMG 21470 / R-8282) TaxID=865937 RepID=H2BXT7_GILLR|nr:hypothetical protein [Gillisia limnaea]EHQ02100.1 hypothetical protein Gilli_1445 [Gillisia limnaea DSM 15749]